MSALALDLHSRNLCRAVPREVHRMLTQAQKAQTKHLPCLGLSQQPSNPPGAESMPPL